MRTLAQLADDWLEEGRVRLMTKGRVDPHLIILYPRGSDEGCTVPMVWRNEESKQLRLQMAATAAELLDADRYVTVAEVWMTTQDDHPGEDLKGSLAWPKVRPSEHPNRQEVVWVTAHDENGKHVQRGLMIKRDYKSDVAGTEPFKMPGGGDGEGTAAGTFTEVLSNRAVMKEFVAMLRAKGEFEFFLIAMRGLGVELPEHIK